MSVTPVLTNLSIDEKKLVVHSYQDVEDIIEENKRRKSMPQKSDCLREIAEVPNNILLQWLNEEYARGNVNMKMFDAEFNNMVARKLRDHDWLFLRTDK